MSFINCINNQVKAKKLTKSQAKKLKNEYQELFDKYKQTMGDTQAAHAAAQKFVEVKQGVITKKRENDIAHAITLNNVRTGLDQSAKKITKEKDKATKGMKWIHGNPYARAIRDKLQNVYDKQQSLMRDTLVEISDTVETFRSKAGGFKQDVEGFQDVVREAMGIKTGNDSAAAHGAGLNKVFEKLRQMYDDAGGVLGKVDNYFPVHHEPELVARASFDEWAGYIAPLLDRQKMIDVETGLPYTDKQFKDLLKSSYENIKSNGLVDVRERAAEGMQTFGIGGDVATRRINSRVLHFKDADSFLNYNTKFGRGDAGLYDTVLDHISAMTRDIAIMQEMGPKPTAVMRNLQLEMEGREILPTTVKPIMGMYDVLAGKTGYGGKIGPMYKFTQGWLNIKRSAYLGSAVIPALGDTFFISLAAKMNGVPAMKTMGQYLKLLNPLDGTDRDVARHLFYYASAAQGRSLQGARFSDDIGGGGVTKFLAGMTNRISGLAAMTDAGRQAPMMAQASMMSRYAAEGRSWDSLENGIKQAAEQFGIGKREWEVIMQAQSTTHPDMDGAAWLMPENVSEIDPVVARKYSTWMTKLGNLAVNEPTLLTRTVTTGAFLGDARQGTLLRLMASNVFFAKSFPITIMINQLLPSLRSASVGRMGHLTAVAGGSLVMGALALQVRGISQGKTTEDMDNGKFWMRAGLQGGGLGLFGDFLLQDYNKYGQSIGGSAAGPVVGTVQALLKAGNLQGVADGEWDTQKFGADIFKIGAREIPAVNLWYSRLVVERMMLDQVERMIDPKFDARVRRFEKKAEKEQGQRFWWREGEMLPEGAK